MAKEKIKIFYSWQSDLKGNETRNFISDCIKDTVKHMKDTIEIEVDRDTKGEFGSPDIVQTIFSKIDNCDIFIADVSVVNKYTTVSDCDEENEIRCTPNPNVMLELGYASNVVGWDNIICIINTDYGEIKELPFDIAHRRLTPYSLKNTDNSKSDVRKAIMSIISSTIINLKENGKRVKSSYANHIVGSYDFESNSISEKLEPLNPRLSNLYIEKRNKMLEECKFHIDKINTIKLNEPTELICPETNINISIPTLEGINLFDKQSRVINVEDRQEIKEFAKTNFNVDLDDSFFAVGDLQYENSLPPVQGSKNIGTEDEKEKYHEIIALNAKKIRLEVFDSYISTFNGLYILPLAIKNISTVADDKISISIIVDEETADIIKPEKTLIFKDDSYVKKLIVDENLLDDILKMSENENVKYPKKHIDTTISPYYSMSNIDISNEVESNEVINLEYEDNLKNYISDPLVGQKNNEFYYEIDSLRANEINWLDTSIVLKPKSDIIQLTYTIKSAKSDGNISRKLSMNVDSN